MEALNVTQVATKTSLAKQTIRNWSSIGKFPRPFKLGGRAVWDSADIDDWLLTQKQLSQTGDHNEAE